MKKLINFLKRHGGLLSAGRTFARFFLHVTYLCPIKKKTMIFASFGGRKFDDSPRAIYDQIIHDPAFADWKLIWAFTEPEKVDIPRGEKVKMDSCGFYRKLFTSRVWVSNSGMDRGFELRNPRILRVETWHGTPLKKICGEEHTNATKRMARKRLDKKAIRCAQSEYDRQILARVLASSPESFLMCDLPRNDSLLRYTPEQKSAVRKALGIPEGKKVILYMPTYREYLLNENKENYIAPPMQLAKWRERLSDEYVLLMRAHYAVSAALELTEDEFVKDASGYGLLNDLYAIADILISDYSSAFIDGAICGMPMLCFAYDLAEYEEKRGLYLDLAEALPCTLCACEDELLAQIENLNYAEASEKTRAFAQKYAPYAGKATETVVAEMKRRLGL